MIRTKLAILGTAVMGLVLAGNVMASPIIPSSETWASGDGGWHLENYGDSSITYGNSGAGSLQLSFTGVSGTRQAVMYTTSANFTGGYLGQPADFVVGFTFTAVNEGPSSVGLYFRGSASQREWTYNAMTAPGASSTASYTLSTALQDYNNWSWLGGTPWTFEQWQADFANIDRFGIYVLEDPGSGSENYQLDNLTLTVPEPESVWLIFAALASLGVTFRGKVTDAVRGLVKRS